MSFSLARLLELSASPFPLAGTSTALASATSTAAIDLSAHVGKRVRVVASVAARVRAGATDPGEATADDALLPANVPEVFVVTPARQVIRAYGTAVGTLSIAVVD